MTLTTGQQLGIIKIFNTFVSYSHLGGIYLIKILLNYYNLK